MELDKRALTPLQEKQWNETRCALLWHCPAFSHVFYTMMNRVGSDYIAVMTDKVPIAATDGSSLILNPETFFKYPLKKRIFVCAHEILHCIFNHCSLIHMWKRRGKVAYPDGIELPYVHEVMNWAMDFVINDILIEAKVGEFDENWLHDKTIATSKDSVLDAYKKLYKQCKVSKGGGVGEAPKGQGFDEHLAPGTSEGKDPQQAAQGRNETEWKTAVAAGASAAKAQGKLPAGLERLFNEMLEPVVDWRDKIEGLFARKVGAGSYDWRRPDRRLIVRDIYAPGRSGFGANCVVLGVDTSGSIGPRELDAFFAEMAGILEEVHPRRLLVMWCDARVDRIDEAEDASDLNIIRNRGVPGGGGTSFRPVFQEISDMGLECDALVYLTDGYGDFPDKEPTYPVIWGNISKPGAVKYPFGDVVDIPTERE